jgi:hypothetical protein
MSDYHRLVSVLKTIGGYTNDEINIIAATACRVETERLQASRSGLTELPTPMAAAASDPKRAMLIKQVCGQIKTATRYRWELPLDKPVSLDQLTIALKDASIDQRLAIKDALFHAGLIPA